MATHETEGSEDAQGPSRRQFIGGSAAAIGGIAAATMLSSDGASAATGASAAAKRTGTIKDVKHVVILMQENRSFDHYYGALRGVHGFADQQVLSYPDGSNVFQQPDRTRSGAPYLLPWHMDTRQYDAQDAGDLDHSWSGTHSAWNSGAWNRWIATKGEQTMGYFNRDDIPFQYALADAFTLCDGYHCSIQGPTTPNRLFHWTGTNNPAGDAGGPAIDNPADYNPVYSWKTYPERLQAAGVTWQVFANDEVGDGDDGWVGDYGDNPLWLFQAYHDSLNSTDPAKQDLARRASLRKQWLPDSGLGQDVNHVLQEFTAACAAGTLPTVSWVVAPYGYCEHPAARPVDGANYTSTVLKALWGNKSLWESTAVFINFDENDGYFDHVLPPTPPPGTADEYVDGLPIGLGPRVPMTVISPWSRGGWVNSQTFDHTSVLRFLEVLTGVNEPNISDWRRSVCGDLTSCFDFKSFDPSIPTLPDTAHLVAIANGQESLPVPSAPTGSQNAPIVETGTRKQRTIPYRPNGSVSINRTTGRVTATLANGGQAAMSFGAYPANVSPFAATPVLVAPKGKGTFAYDSAATDGVYDIAIVGPNGFLRRFAGAVVPVGQSDVGIPAVTASASATGLTIRLSNAGATEVRFSLQRNDFAGTARTVYVKKGKSVTIAWPLQNGWYDVSIAANTGTGFAYRYAGHV